MTKPKITCMPTRIATSSTSKITGIVAENRERGTSHQRGYGHAWRKARKEFLRANPLCVMCRARGFVVAADTVDHKIPHKGNVTLFWDRENWQALCSTCHSSHKQAQEYADGY